MEDMSAQEARGYAKQCERETKERDDLIEKLHRRINALEQIVEILHPEAFILNDGEEITLRVHGCLRGTFKI